MPCSAWTPELIQSHPRKRRIDDLLSKVPGTIGVDDVQAALRDPDAYPRPMCRHPNDDEGTGFWQTVLSVIVEPRQLRMHVDRATRTDAMRFTGGHEQYARAIAFVPDGSRIVAGSWDKSVFVWDVATDHPTLRFDARDNVDALAVSPDGRRIGAACDGGVIVWFAP